tara:strand:- start:30982 stop:32106 length:1125 start_codon:yes stop_codon:yes gene_type:complete
MTNKTTTILGNPRTIVGLLVALGILIAGFWGSLVAAWGYAFFLGASAFWGIAIFFALIFLFTKYIETNKLRRLCKIFFLIGLWSYIYCIASFGGFFTSEAFLGNVDYKYIIFGPTVLAALGILEYGVYRALITNNRPTFNRYRRFLSRESIDHKSLRKTLIDDVILHKSLYKVSFIRWLRHTLILWGFAFLVLTELTRVVFQEAFPAFGLPDVWHIPGHPVRLVIGFLYDFFGLMVTVGCVIAIGWRIAIGNSEEKKFSDTPTVWFILFVMISGYLVEALRISSEPMDAWYIPIEFVGYLIALPLVGHSDNFMKYYDALWLIHVIGSCLFMAYIPLKRAIHMFATPFGRLMNSQLTILRDKRNTILSHLNGRDR